MRGAALWRPFIFSLDEISTKIPKKPLCYCSHTKGQPLISVSGRKCKRIVWFGVWISFSLNSSLSCRALAYFNAPRQKDLANCNLFQNFQFRGWLRIVSFSFWRRIQSRNITKQLKKESKLAFLAVLFSRGIRVLRFIAVSNGGQEQ